MVPVGSTARRKAGRGVPAVCPGVVFGALALTLIPLK